MEILGVLYFLGALLEIVIGGIILKLAIVRIMFALVLMFISIKNFNIKKLLLGIATIICGELTYYYMNTGEHENFPGLPGLFEVFVAYATIVFFEIFIIYTIKSIKNKKKNNV